MMKMKCAKMKDNVFINQNKIKLFYNRQQLPIKGWKEDNKREREQSTYIHSEV